MRYSPYLLISVNTANGSLYTNPTLYETCGAGRDIAGLNILENVLNSGSITDYAREDICALVHYYVSYRANVSLDQIQHILSYMEHRWAIREWYNLSPQMSQICPAEPIRIPDMSLDFENAITTEDGYMKPLTVAQRSKLCSLWRTTSMNPTKTAQVRAELDKLTGQIDSQSVAIDRHSHSGNSQKTLTNYHSGWHQRTITHMS